MASDKETAEGSEKQEEVKEDPTVVEEKDEVAELGTEKEGEEKESDKEDEDEEMEEAEKEGNEGHGEQDEDEEDEVKEEKKVKRGSRGKKKSDAAAELPSPRTPGSERPTRERKMVERFMVTETPRVTSAKSVSIEKVHWLLLFLLSCF